MKKFSKRWLVVPLVAGSALVGAVGPGFASSAWQAGQTGFHQWGNATATTLTIRVEAAVDGNTVLVPDQTSLIFCSQLPSCPGGALSFTIENTSSVPIQPTDIAQQRVTCGSSTCPADVLSDRNDDGTWQTPPAGFGTDGNSCGKYVSVATQSFLTSIAGSRPLPIIPPHSVLAVNGTDSLALGAHMVHLHPLTSSACQGANFYVPIQVTAHDAS